MDGIKINSNVKMKIRNSNFFMDPEFGIGNIFHITNIKILKKVGLKYFQYKKFFYIKFNKINFKLLIKLIKNWCN